MCLTFSHRSDSSNIRAPRIFISSPRKFLNRSLTRAVPRQNENPGDLFSSPGFGIFRLTLSSGPPIGELCRNNRYSDNNAYYNYVENKPADAQSRLTGRRPVIKRELGTTVGHDVLNL